MRMVDEVSIDRMYGSLLEAARFAISVEPRHLRGGKAWARGYLAGLRSSALATEHCSGVKPGLQWLDEMTKCEEVVK